MATKINKIAIHPHIDCVRNICGGSPVIKGTRTTVRTIIKFYQAGFSIEDILRELPHLSPADVYDALAFYYDNKVIIDKDIQLNEDTSYWKNLISKK
ncbi:MAG: DUF433 domain-containing protein [Candidatus Omnitrophica bacterium]|nr:DUF433 domain-containing protein [Candidatus Omnitrophota bacterium]